MSAYNLGRIGVSTLAMLRMVDQPREDGPPRTLVDVILNNPESPSTILQRSVRDAADAVTVGEAVVMVEGYPEPMHNIHLVLKVSFVNMH